MEQVSEHFCLALVRGEFQLPNLGGFQTISNSAGGALEFCPTGTLKRPMMDSPKVQRSSGNAIATLWDLATG